MMLLLGSCSELEPPRAVAKAEIAAPSCEIDPQAVCRDGYRQWSALARLSNQHAGEQFWLTRTSWETFLRLPAGSMIAASCSADNQAPGNIGGVLQHPPKIDRGDVERLRHDGLCIGAAAPAAKAAPTAKPRNVAGACAVDAANLCARFYLGCWDRTAFPGHILLGNVPYRSTWYWSNSLLLSGAEKLTLSCSAGVGPQALFSGTASYSSALTLESLRSLQAAGLCSDARRTGRAAIGSQVSVQSLACEKFSPELIATWMWGSY